MSIQTSVMAIILTLSVGIMACSPAATPASPTAKPAAQPTAAPKTESQPAAAAPAAPKTEAPAAAPKSDATAAWNQVVEAAKREKLVIASMPGENDKKVMATFQMAFPDISVEHTGARPSDFSPKLIAEQQNGVFAWDVMESSGTSNMHEVLLPTDAFQDLKPFLMLPEAMDDSKWGTGKFELYTSPNKQHILIHEVNLGNGLFINREVVPESDLKTLDDLLDPKWQGKMVLDDCTVAAQGAAVLIGLWQAKGEAFVRQLLSTQKPVWQDTVRITTEWVATGRYPIGLGVSEPELTRLQNEGVGKSLKQLEYGGGNMAASGVAVFRNAPNPNAARVFVNWFLTKEGQQAWVDGWEVPTPRNSRRLDVPIKNQAAFPNYANLSKYALWGTDSGTEIVKKVNAMCKELRP
jgi:iron(III) transport system substrate-binding protein